MRAVIYLRVSTKEQAEEGYSIAAQQAACSRYVADKTWDLVETYTDRGESARTADRPQFQLMLDRIREDGSIKFLVVHKLDRLARNVKDYATVREMLEKAGVQLVSVTEGLEATASGKMVEGMLAVVAEWYSNNLSHEIRKGQDQKLREGGWPTMAPIGYQNVRVDTT
ncbi:MAG: recombinase family protein, partial [Actinomycetota bacterium]